MAQNPTIPLHSSKHATMVNLLRERLAKRAVIYVDWCWNDLISIPQFSNNSLTLYIPFFILMIGKSGNYKSLWITIASICLEHIATSLPSNSFKRNMKKTNKTSKATARSATVLTFWSRTHIHWSSVPTPRKQNSVPFTKRSGRANSSPKGSSHGRTRYFSSDTASRECPNREDKSKLAPVKI